VVFINKCLYLIFYVSTYLLYNIINDTKHAKLWELCTINNMNWKKEIKIESYTYIYLYTYL